MKAFYMSVTTMQSTVYGAVRAHIVESFTSGTAFTTCSLIYSIINNSLWPANYVSKSVTLQ